MKNSDLILVPALVGAPSIVEIARDTRDTLVLDAALIRTVTDASAATEAANALRALKEFTDQIEAQRKDVKAPCIALGKKIDALAAELTDAATEQYNRLRRLVGDWTAEQNRIRAEAEEKARDEERRIMAEAEEKAQKAIDSGKGIEGKLERIDAKAFQQVANVRAEVATVAPKMEGVGVRTEPVFEITDIAALYSSRPELVKMEVNTAALKAILRACPSIKLPGVKHWTEAKAVIR